MLMLEGLGEYKMPKYDPPKKEDRVETSMAPMVAWGALQLLSHIWGVAVIRDNARAKYGRSWRDEEFPGRFVAKHSFLSLLIPYISGVGQLRAARHFGDNTLYVSGLAQLAPTIMNTIGTVKLAKPKPKATAVPFVVPNCAKSGKIC